MTKLITYLHILVHSNWEVMVSKEQGELSQIELFNSMVNSMVNLRLILKKNHLFGLLP